MKINIKTYLNIFVIFLSLSLFYTTFYNLKNISFLILCAIILILLLKQLNFSKKTAKIDTNINPKQAYIDAFEESASLAKLNLDFEIKYTNRSFCQITLCTKEECLNKKLDYFLDEQEEILSEIYETLINGQSWEGTLFLNALNHSNSFIQCSIIPILNIQNELKEYLLIAHNITELAISKKVIQENVYIDSHTKLPNRICLIKDKAKFSKNDNLTLIMLNIDSFQAINTIYGNNFGDDVLKVFAKWIKDNVPTIESKVYKFESDVYAILIPTIYTKQELKQYLKNLNLKISKNGLTCHDIDINLSFTIGCAQGVNHLLKHASIAYKEAKKAQKSYIIYDPENKKEEEYINNTKMIGILKKSLENNLIIPFFQPIMNIKTKKIDKYEALMRIKKEDGGVFLPFDFLDIAKHSRLYPSLSRDMIKKSFDTFKYSCIEFSVNLSFLDIANHTTNKFIFDILNEYDIGSWVVFEILESEGINNYDTVLKFVNTAKSYGAKIAIDDFGSGYSNFERILRLQPDYIKLDGSLIKNIDKNDDMQILTQTIIDFANKLDIKTVAEYVHSKEVLDIITQMGVDFAQGYHIGKPSAKML
jgi:diguanylate cyclase (GGDEF)-like protein